MNALRAVGGGWWVVGGGGSHLRAVVGQQFRRGLLRRLLTPTTNHQPVITGPMPRALLFLLASVLAAAEPATPDLIVDKGLAALVKVQTPDGLIGGDAVSTAVAGMALLAGGHTPTRGIYREASSRALKAVLAKQDPFSGYLGGDYGNMYAHGFATLYLAECYGMAPDVPVRRAVESAIELIHKAQNAEGGWRYSPTPVDADISVTVCQVMALRGAYNVGIGGQVSQTAIAKAVAYVRRCQNADGSMNYQAGQGMAGQGPDGIPRTAAGAMSLIGSGVSDPADKSLGPALTFLKRHVKNHLEGGGGHFSYGQYYAAQALFHSPFPEDWADYWNAAQPVLVKRQGPDGFWPQDDHNPVFSSAIALVILQIPNHYLPIFQR
jgi:hypothetical protein